MGRAYISGKGVPADMSEAIVWMKFAADHGEEGALKNLAVYYSKARNAGKTDLYYTHVKYLRRAKNGPKGLVLPTQEKNLCIEPDKARLTRLDSLHEEGQL